MKVFTVQTAYSFSSFHRSTIERELVWVCEQRHTCHPTYLPPPTPLAAPEGTCESQLNWQPTPKRLPPQLTNFQNSLIFLYFKIQYIISISVYHWCDFIILSYCYNHHMCPQLSLCFHIKSIKLMTRHESILFTFTLPV